MTDNTSKCEICGTEDDLYFTWYLKDFSTLCLKHERMKFLNEPASDLFKHFKPDEEIQERIAKNYILTLKYIAELYRDKGKDEGDLACKALKICLER